MREQAIDTGTHVFIYYQHNPQLPSRSVRGYDTAMKLKRFLSVAALLFMGLTLSCTLTACGDDDPPASDDKPITPVTPDTPDDPEPEEPSSKYMVISSIIDTDNLSGVPLEKFASPKYGVASWLGKTVLEGYDTYTFKYNFPKTATMKCDYEYGSDDIIDYTLATDHVTSFTGINSGDGELVYDSKMRLTTVKVALGSLRWEYSYKYDNTFNIIESKATHQGEVLKYNSAKINYTTIPAKCAPLQWLVSPTSVMDVTKPWAFFEAGLFGNTMPLYLIDSVIFDDGTEVEYSYITNRDGYVTQMREDKYMPNYHYIHTYDITWESVSTPTYSNWLFNDESSPYSRYLK